MTWLFVRFYLCVLVVLFLAWYIHGEVSKQRALAERSRVFEAAHAGGVRLMTGELDSVDADDREEVLRKLREKFEYPVVLMQTSELPDRVQNRLRQGDDVVHYIPDDGKEVVVAALSNKEQVIRLGPFRDYGFRSIEKAIGGWMRLAAEKLAAADETNEEAILDDFRQKFEFPVAIVRQNTLPDWPKYRVEAGANVVFYLDANEKDLAKSQSSGSGNDRPGFAVTRLANKNKVLRCGPFPNFENIGEKAATTTLAFVLLPVALTIALLLRPVAQQLRRVEEAAKAIAAGDLSARVNEQHVGAARPLAQAFNIMAGQTETLVRTQRELLQAVSHELRTPLSRMRFAIELIETAKDPDERRERLNSLDTAAEELDTLVGELLGYVRMESAQPQLNKESIAVKEVIAQMLPQQSTLNPKKHFEVGDVDDEEILADRLGFQRAIGNLLLNAGRYAKSQIKIHSKTDGDLVVIDVDDDGCGIPEDERIRVLEPFVRLNENDSNGNGRGVGLGLAIVQRIVEQHGGRIEIHNSPLGGCRTRTLWPRVNS
jgi:signal transduction histidine kinase